MGFRASMVVALFRTQLPLSSPLFASGNQVYYAARQSCCETRSVSLFIIREVDFYASCALLPCCSESLHLFSPPLLFLLPPVPTRSTIPPILPRGVESARPAHLSWKKNLWTEPPIKYSWNLAHLFPQLPRYKKTLKSHISDGTRPDSNTSTANFGQ